jgi:hypothetical protein
VLGKGAPRQFSNVWAIFMSVVEGDQYVAPSVAETAPDVIDCTFVGQQFPAKGSYLGRVDDFV